MAATVAVCTVKELPDGDMQLAQIADGREIAIFRRGDCYFAFENRCPHKGGPLGLGVEKHGILTCPWHRFRFYLESGISVTNPDMRATTFGVRADGGQVVVILPT